MSTPMDYRSTNADGRYTHFGGALVAGVEFGRGIELNPDSTAAAPNIKPAGDDANIGMLVKAKGTGELAIGDSSNTVVIRGNPKVGSTASGSLGFKGAFTALSTISWTAITAGHGREFTLASTTLDVMPGDLLSVGLVVDTADLSSQTGIASWRLSTVNASRFTAVLNTFGSTAGSTGSGTLQISWLDLT